MRILAHSMDKLTQWKFQIESFFVQTRTLEILREFRTISIAIPIDLILLLFFNKHSLNFEMENIIIRCNKQNNEQSHS